MSDSTTPVSDENLHPATSTETPKRSISQRQQRNLEKLLKSDFTIARTELYEERMRAIAAVGQNLKSENDELISLLQGDEVDALIETTIAEVAAVRERLVTAVEALGLTLDEGRYYGSHQNPTPLSRPVGEFGRIRVPGFQEEVERRQRLIDTAHRDALLVLAQNEADAERKILLAGIDSADAMDLVRSIPKPLELLEAQFGARGIAPGMIAAAPAEPVATEYDHGLGTNG